MKLLDRKEFDALPKNEQRVRIAIDVVARINAGVLQPAEGNLLSFYDEDDESFEAFDSPFGYKKEIPNIQEYFNNNNDCGACAKGALVCSWVGNFNHYTYSDVRNMEYDLHTHSYPKELIDIFGTDMLNLMEVEFEGQIFPWSDFSFSFVNITGNYKHNLIKIMENIIDNDGEFIP